jgi:hypothetical protein
MRAIFLLATALLAMTAQAETPAAATVLELRQYKIFPGQRDAMIDVFEGKLIEGQEQVGMRLLGQFRDLDDPDRFTWMREFDNVGVRAKALDDFYTGPVWRAHRNEANPLLEDNDNVLLLRPATSQLALRSPPASDRAEFGTSSRPAGVIVATIYYLWKDPAEGFSDFFTSRLAPELVSAGLPVLGAYVIEPTPNDFPKLPVRQHEKVFVWFTRVANAPALEKAQTTLNARLKSSDSLGRELARHQERPAQILRLAPTPRSLLR